MDLAATSARFFRAISKPPSGVASWSAEGASTTGCAARLTSTSRGFLRELFLASLADGRNPRTWIDQNEAMVNAARYLGFRNTGPRIQRHMKTAMRLLIRSGPLERDGKYIRRT